MDPDTLPDTSKAPENVAVDLSQENPVLPYEIPTEPPQKKGFPFIPVASALVIMAAFGFVMLNYEKKQVTDSRAADETVNSFATCTATKGSVVTAMYPPVCIFPNGRKVMDPNATVVAPPSGGNEQYIPGHVVDGSTTTTGGSPGSASGGAPGSVNDVPSNSSALPESNPPSVINAMQIDSESVQGKNLAMLAPNTAPISQNSDAGSQNPGTSSSVSKNGTLSMIGTNVPSNSTSTWDTCTHTQNSKMLQTYPVICVMPDGTRVTDPNPAGNKPTGGAVMPINQGAGKTVPGSSNGTAPISNGNTIPGNTSSNPNIRLMTGVVNSNDVSSKWDDCIKMPNSKLLQTYPVVCVLPNGIRVTDPSSTPVNAPISSKNGTAPGSVATPMMPNPGSKSPGQIAGSLPGTTSPGGSNVPGTGGNDTTNSTWDACVQSAGSVVYQTYPRICAFKDGRRVTEPTPSAVPPIPEPTHIILVTQTNTNIFQTLYTNIWCGVFKQCSMQ